MRKAIRAAATFSALACLSACATVTGTVVGPVAFPVSDIRHTAGVPWWGRIVTVPFGILVGPFYGAAQGASADYGFVANGAYGQGFRPEFDIVFDPLDVDRDWREVTAR